MFKRNIAALGAMMGLVAPGATPAAPQTVAPERASEVSQGEKKAPVQAPQQTQSRTQARVRRHEALPDQPGDVRFGRDWNPPAPAYTYGQRKGGHGKQSNRGSWRVGSSARRAA